jgi:hypothetical protein
MTQEVIDIGAIPNDSNGSPVRVAFQEINNNFANLANIFSEPPSSPIVNTEPQNATATPVSSPFTGNITISANNIYFGSQINTIQQTTVQPLSNIVGQEVINVGDAPNDGLGDPIRLAFEKINNNFANLFALGTSTTTITQVPVPIEDPTASMLTFTQPIGPYYNQEYINVGATPNDGTGDPLRTAFEKINNNFSNLFYVGTVTSSTYSIGLTPNQVIFETPANMFSQASFQIRSSDTGTPDSQDITITAQISNDSANVKYTGYGTTFFGNALTRYNMDVFDGNIRLMVNPIVDQVLLHFISAQITFVGDTANGINIALDGYTDSVLDTENGFEITTEAG